MPLPRFALIVPTHNRRDTLAEVLARAPLGDPRVEAIVVDNASTDGTGERLAEAFPSVRVIRLSDNHGTAGRNLAAAAADAEILVMLDDDSFLHDGALDRIELAFAVDPALGALGAATTCPTAAGVRWQDGGLPGVFVGCAAAIRREAFLAVGGYPIDFGYYVEEYDLCCRLWRAGWRVAWYEDIAATHLASPVGRDKDRILRHLVRNNLRLWTTYAPAGRRQALLAETTERYHRIAIRENAIEGFRRGWSEGMASCRTGRLPRRELSEAQFAAMYGLDEATERLGACAARGVRRVGLLGCGKGAEQLLECAARAGLPLTCVVEPPPAEPAEACWHDLPIVTPPDARAAGVDALIVGTLSPGAARQAAAGIPACLRGLPLIDPVAWRRCPQPLAATA